MAELVIARELVAELVMYCRACLPHEACGILAGTGDRATKVYLMTNAEPSPVSYLMEPGEQFRVMKEMRQEGLNMVAIFHSHPQSPAYPSAKDLRLAFYDDVYYVIVGLLREDLPEVRVFSMKGGEVTEDALTVIG